MTRNFWFRSAASDAGCSHGNTQVREQRTKKKFKRVGGLTIVSFVVFVTLAVVSVAGAEQRVSTRAAFLKVGNAICSRATQQMDLIGITFFESPGHSTRAERMAFARKVAIPTAQHELAQLRALRPPTGDALRVKLRMERYRCEDFLVDLVEDGLVVREPTSASGNDTFNYRLKPDADQSADANDSPNDGGVVENGETPPTTQQLQDAARGGGEVVFCPKKGKETPPAQPPSNGKHPPSRFAAWCTASYAKRGLDLNKIIAEHANDPTDYGWRRGRRKGGRR